MENAVIESKQFGARSKQARLWIASKVIADLNEQPLDQVHQALVTALGPELKPKDISGALQFQKLYEETVQRGRDFAQQFAGGLDLNNPAVIRMMTGLQVKGASEGTTQKDPVPLDTAGPISSVTDDDLAIPEPAAAADGTENNADYMFDDWAIGDDVEAVASEADPIQQAANAYVNKIRASAKIPTVPYTRPDLGVTFFPSGRFEVGSTDWNYNGQIEGKMISATNVCGAPTKIAALDFRDFALSKTQQATGVIWIWAVQHQVGLGLRFWLNDGKDQLKFRYEIVEEGVTQERRHLVAPGKFELLEPRRLILPMKLEGAPPLRVKK